MALKVNLVPGEVLIGIALSKKEFEIWRTQEKKWIQWGAVPLLSFLWISEVANRRFFWTVCKIILTKHFPGSNEFIIMTLTD